MTEQLPPDETGQGEIPDDPNRLNPVVFELLVRRLVELSGKRGADLKAGQAPQFQGSGLPVDALVGRWVVIQPPQAAVTAKIDIMVYNEAAGILRDQSSYGQRIGRPVATVFAHTQLLPEAASRLPAEAPDGISGLVGVFSNGYVHLDLDHGTEPSQDPEVQADLNQITRLLGLGDDFMDQLAAGSEEREGFYDNEEVVRLTGVLEHFITA